jgi:hypothetical protein
MTFKSDELRRQLSWRSATTTLSPEARVPGLYTGRSPGDARGRDPMFIHETRAEENLLPAVREEAITLFRNAGIRWHDGPGDGRPSNFLMDSMVSCVNCLLPFAHDGKALARLMRSLVPDALEAKPIEEDRVLAFEWLGIGNPLGETSPKRTRGSHGTSADAYCEIARSDGGRTGLLIEWKYTERYLDEGGKPGGPRYAPLLKADDGPIDLDTCGGVEALFVEPLYQLARLQLLAQAMERAPNSGCDRVLVVVIVPEGNLDYRTRVPDSPLRDRFPGVPLAELWPRLLRRPDRFALSSFDSLLASFPSGEFPAVEPALREVRKRYAAVPTAGRPDRTTASSDHQATPTPHLGALATILRRTMMSRDCQAAAPRNQKRRSREPEMSHRVQDGASGRAYSLACLSLARAEQLDARQRKALDSRIASEKRHLVLEGLTGFRVAPGALITLSRCVAEMFTRADWLLLLRILDKVEHRRVLGHLRRITPSLVSQFEAIPSSVRVPSVLGLANHLALPTSRWKHLGDALDSLGEGRKASLLRVARKIRGPGDFWDFIFRSADAVSDGRPFPSGAPELGPLLVRLATPALMRREALAMRNCLADCIHRAARGESAYYRWIGADPATVELLNTSNAWRLRTIRGVRNSAVPARVNDAIRRELRGALGTACIDADAEHELPNPEPVPGMASAEAIGRSHFTSDERAEVAQALWRIQRRSLTANKNAFCVFESGDGYVQFLACLDGLVYQGEISSHRCMPSVADRLTEETVSFLEASGFAWPAGRDANFARDFVVRDASDCAHLADFALGALHSMFGHESGQPLSVNVHVPEIGSGRKSPERITAA